MKKFVIIVINFALSIWNAISKKITCLIINDRVYSTEMYCEAGGVMDQEAHYFELLSKVESFSISGDALTLTTSSGETLVFEKTTF